MRRRIFSVLTLLGVLALTACPGEGPQVTESDGTHSIILKESIGTEDAVGDRGSGEPVLLASYDARTNAELIADMRAYARDELGVDEHHFLFYSGRVHVEAVCTHLDENGNPLHVYPERQTFNLVVTAGLEFIVDAFQNTTELEAFNFHGVGTGTTAANVADTACETQVEGRATGTQGENGTTTYQTVGTVTATAARAITEACLMSASSGGTMLARQVFTVINLATNDSIQTTWEITVSMLLLPFGFRRRFRALVEAERRRRAT